MNYNIKCNNPLRIGYQGDHNANVITLVGYNPIRVDSSVAMMIEGLGIEPLVKNEEGYQFIVHRGFTQIKNGRYTAQLIEVYQDELVAHSNVFSLILNHSLSENEPIVPLSPQDELWFQKFTELYQEVESKLESGYFVGPPGPQGPPGQDGKDGKVDEEQIEHIIEEVEQKVKPYDDTSILQQLHDKADVSEIPTKTSQLENDSGFLTEHQPLKTINNQSIIGTGNIVISGGGGGINDVQVAGSSVVTDGTANIQVAGGNNLGVIRKNANVGFDVNSAGYPLSIEFTKDVYAAKDNYSFISKGTLENIKANYVKEAITSTTDPEWTAEEQANAKARMGIVDSGLDVQINGTSIVQDGVANIPLATAHTAGVLGHGSVSGGLYLTSDGVLQINKPIDLYMSNRSKNHGLTLDLFDKMLKFAMCDGKGSAYTDLEKQAARDRLGVINYDDSDIRARINAIEVSKFPNLTIIGQPTINQGQLSNFSSSNYARFPFVVNFQNRPFNIKMDITTGSNIVSQENVIDSDFGLALAIRNSRFILAFSVNGTSWAAEYQGSHQLAANTAYLLRLNWDGSTYKLEFSTDGGENYITDITFTNSQSPYPKQIYVGVGQNNGVIMNHFSGIINLNNCELVISGKTVWLGMDDVGLATRLAVDLSNIDNAGVDYINSLINSVVGSKTLSSFTDDLGSSPIHTHSQYLTQHQSLSGYATQAWVNQQGFAKTSAIPTDDHINQLINNALGVIENGTY